MWRMKNMNKKMWVILLVLLFLPLMPNSMAASEKEMKDDALPLVDNIQFDGICSGALFIRYRALPVTQFNPNESRYRIGLAIIGFKDADINVNNGEVDEEAGSGVLILFHYLGEYNLNYQEKTMMLDGNAWLIRVNLD
jgi:hypothetical protein